MKDRNQESIATRHSLLDRLKDWADEASWREFFDTYWELIYNVARKAGLTDSEAQEAVQETVIGLAKNIGGFDTDARRGSFKAWLLHQARWRIADQFRKRKSGSLRVYQSARSSDEATGTGTVNRIADPALSELESVWNEEWQQHVMRAALERVKSQVSEKQFQMFDLHTLQGLSVTEAARALGVSVASVYMAKSRISRLLRHALAHVTKERP